MAKPLVPLSIGSVLKSGDFRLTRLVQITRTDGTILRLTDWDQQITFRGNVFTPMAPLDASARETSSGITGSEQEVSGFISSEAITTNDLISRFYDDAEIDEYLISAPHPWAGPLYYRKYFVESTQRTNNRFFFRIGDIGSKWIVTTGDLYTKECTNKLGDAYNNNNKAGCKYDLAGSGTITGLTVGSNIPNARLKFTSDAVQAGGFFNFGEVQWLTGDNAGLTSNVELYVLSSGTFTLLEETPFNIADGDTFDAVQGCTKTVSACQTTFSQFDNFRGYPHIPGTDQILVTPKSKT